ncbi:MAG: methylenetetrahydrofolate reductase [NAD(P)H] [Bacteriovoracaceae bacterium]|nr:methylenetetrahydrofolate reductase [NAD(P)H] [Bacteriovoracaceae bacterium]
MTKIVEHLKHAKETLFSFEILPPVKGQSIQTLFGEIEPLMEFKPSFIDVTYHREEYVYKKRPNGLLEKISIKKRPGTVGICSAIMNKFKIDAIPHIICGGFTKEETENALIDLSFLGIDNVLLLRGDAIKTEPNFTPEKGGNVFATDLIKQVVNMNNGIYLDMEQENTSKTNFCIGVAGYPEKHFEAPNLNTDLKYLKMKVDMGAEYIVTQMFFDNDKYFDFVNRCREVGIKVPIIPGLKPITSLKQITNLPRIFHIDIPEALADALEGCENNQDAQNVGIEWCIMQSKELRQKGVPCLHFYSMSQSGPVRNICKELF